MPARFYVQPEHPFELLAEQGRGLLAFLEERRRREEERDRLRRQEAREEEFHRQRSQTLGREQAVRQVQLERQGFVFEPGGARRLEPRTDLGPPTLFAPRLAQALTLQQGEPTVQPSLAGAAAPPPAAVLGARAQLSPVLQRAAEIAQRAPGVTFTEPTVSFDPERAPIDPEFRRRQELRGALAGIPGVSGPLAELLSLPGGAAALSALRPRKGDTQAEQTRRQAISMLYGEYERAVTATSDPLTRWFGMEPAEIQTTIEQENNLPPGFLTAARNFALRTGRWPTPEEITPGASARRPTDEEAPEDEEPAFDASRMAELFPSWYTEEDVLTDAIAAGFSDTEAQSVVDHWRRRRSGKAKGPALLRPPVGLPRRTRTNNAPTR